MKAFEHTEATATNRHAALDEIWDAANAALSDPALPDDAREVLMRIVGHCESAA